MHFVTGRGSLVVHVSQDKSQGDLRLLPPHLGYSDSLAFIFENEDDRFKSVKGESELTVK